MIGGLLTRTALGPWAPALGFALAAAVLGGGYLFARHAGFSACERQHQAALAQSIQAAWDESRRIAMQDAEVAAVTIVAEREIVTRWREVEKEVVKHVPSDSVCVLAEPGFRLLNDLLANRKTIIPADPAQPDRPATGDDPAGKPDMRRPGGEADRGDGLVLRLPAAPFGPI